MGRRCPLSTAAFFCKLKAKQPPCSGNQSKRNNRNHHFADRAHRERAQALLAHLLEIGAQPHASKGQKKRPARKVRDSCDLLLIEKRIRGKDGDQQETEHELRKLLPEKRGLVRYSPGLASAGPVDRVGKYNEADHGVASCLGQHRKLPRSVRVQRASGGSFGGVVHREAGPQAVGVVAQMEGMADERKREERKGAERKNGGNRKGGVFLVSLDGALRGNNGADAANCGAYREKSREFGTQPEQT